MERYTTFSDWKNQCCQNDCSTQSNPQGQCSPYQITNGIFHRKENKIFYDLYGNTRPQRAKAILRKKNADGGVTLPDFRLYTKLCGVAKTKRTQYVRYRHKNRNTGSWSKTGGPEKNSNIYRHLTYDKGDRNVQQRKDSLFNTWPWETVQCKRMKWEHYLTPYTKIKSKWIKDLNIRPDTVELWHKSQQDLFWSTS